MFEGCPIRIRRPNDYNPMANLGAAPPMLGLAQLGSFAPNAGEPLSDRILVSGLPVVLVEAQVKELLEAFGPLRALELLKNAETGESTGQAFALYADTQLTQLACTGLHGMALGGTSLVVRRATAADGPLGPGFEHLAAAALPPPPPPPLTASSRVLVLENVVDEKELADDGEFADIEEDMREECGKYGAVLALRIPRPAGEGEARPAGLGRVYVQYGSTEEAARARGALHGRKFGGHPVVGLEFDEERFLAGDLA